MNQLPYYLIKLSQGKSTLVDAQTYRDWEGFKWYCHGKEYGYAAARIKKSDGKSSTMYLHRVVSNIHGLPSNVKVDHINGNPFDNRKENLRVCTHRENLRNIKKSAANTSGYKGVSFDKKRNKFRASIRALEKHIHLGYFDDAEDAHSTYCRAAEKYHGSFARFN